VTDVESIWPSFRLDPRDPQHAGLRASDADRELVSSALADAYADGRLTPEEYDERESANLAARTLGELPPLLADLIGPSGGSGPKAVEVRSSQELHRAAVAKHVRDTWELAAGSATPFLVCLVIWLFTGADGYFWPVWLLIPVILATGPSIIGAPAAIRTKEQRLRRKQDEALGAPPPREIEE
jgi:hypothetical protein